MKRSLRLLLLLTYPVLVLSGLLVLGMGFGAAFITDFAVENRTGQSLLITPVGTVGREGRKAPLPVKIAAINAFRTPPARRDPPAGTES